MKNLEKSYQQATDNLLKNPQNKQALFELIRLYPIALASFDHEIAHSIELYVDDLGHKIETLNFLQTLIDESNEQKQDFNALLEGLWAIKILIINTLESYQTYENIEDFFDFIIALKADKNLELDFLVDLLTQLSGEINQDNLPYTILTDTLDYMVGWYSPKSISLNSSVGQFIRNLKKPIKIMIK